MACKVLHASNPKTLSIPPLHFLHVLCCTNAKHSCQRTGGPVLLCCCIEDGLQTNQHQFRHLSRFKMSRKLPMAQRIPCVHAQIQSCINSLYNQSCMLMSPSVLQCNHVTVHSQCSTDTNAIQLLRLLLCPLQPNSHIIPTNCRQRCRS